MKISEVTNKPAPKTSPAEPTDPGYQRFAELMAKYNMLQREVGGTDNLVKVATSVSPDAKTEIDRMRAKAVQIAGPNLQAWDKAYADANAGPSSERSAELAKKFLETATPQDREIAKAKAEEKGFPILNVKVPPMPQQAGDGEKLETLPNGNIRLLKGFEGAFTYDKTGKPLSWTSVNISGLSQSTDLVSGNITVRYTAGPIDVSMVSDKNGKSLDDIKIQYATGAGTLGAERKKGITTKSFTSAKGATGDELGSMSTKDLYSMGNKDKEATYDRAMAQVQQTANEELNTVLKIAGLR